MEYLKYLMLIFLITQHCGVSSLSTGIVGGDDAPAGNWPWHVTLHFFDYYICGGSLISHEWVLTAAHCVSFSPSASYWTVYLGRQSQNISISYPIEVSRGVQSIIPHPEYDPSQLTNDIALVRLSEPVNFTSYISPICLAANDSVFHNGTTCWSTGWVETSFEGAEPNSGTLQELQINVVGNKECDCRFQDFPFWEMPITPKMICAEGETGKGTCFGGSGGPLQCKQGSVWILAGVINLGISCSTGITADSHARVSQFQNWILKNVNGSEIGFVTFKSDGEDKDSRFLCYGDETGLFYPFGNQDVENPSEDDGSSPIVFLEKRFVYFGRVYQQTYVNNNGHLTFDEPLSEPVPNYLLSQINRDIIAPLWTDMDNTVNGTISYRQVTRGGLLLAASNHINHYFPNMNFTASWLFIATWDKVPYFYNSQSAGYGTIDSKNYSSITDENKMSSSSNVNVPGRWAFRVDGGPEEGIFYPYGDEDIKNPAEDFGSSPLISLEQPFAYFGLVYNELYVNNKGYLTFEGPFHQWYPDNFPAYSTRDIIAPLWTDIDITRKGIISYRQVTDGHLLNRASRDINQYYPNLNFSASWAFIVTWDKVPYYGYRRTESTFQVILVSGKHMSFTLMHFGNIAPAIHPVMSGYDTSDSTDFFTIPVSDTTNLSYTSNVNVMGRWIFRTDTASEHNGENGIAQVSRVFNLAAFPLSSSEIGSMVTEERGQILSKQNVNVKHRVRCFVDGKRREVVYKNGFLAFKWPLFPSSPRTLPAYTNRDIVAPLWTDIDNSDFYFQEFRGVRVLQRATNDIRQYFPQTNFTADSVLVCTWDNARYYNTSAEVNNNGLLTFDEPFYERLPNAFPANSTRDIIAPLWAMFDCSVNGRISYRVVTQSRILDRARNDVKQFFPLFGFSVHTVLIASWDKVPYFNNSLTAGYDTVNSANYFSIPVPDANKLSNSSNVNVTGRWVFRVDGGPEEGIFYPYGGVEDEKNPQSDDGSSPLIPLLQPFVYFGHVYDKIFSGYDTICSTNFFLIPVSNIANFPYTSNVDVMGRWVFRVDNSSKRNGLCDETDTQASDNLPSAQVCGRTTFTTNSGIVGGQNASAGHWPWQACLLLDGSQFCGGSLINKEWVLTAAHCVDSFTGDAIYSLTVVLGRQTQEGLHPNEEFRDVRAVIKHPSYNNVTNDSDIALLKLSSPITFTDYISPVCLAADGSVFNSGIESWITGWGNIDERVSLPSPNVLQEVEVPVIGNRQCNCLYRVGNITDNMICAGLLEGGKDSCQGDSGGPMVSNQSSVWVQSGIVSFGCAQPKYPGVYTRVSCYQEWITSFMCSDPPGFVQFTSAGTDSDNSYTCPDPPSSYSSVIIESKVLFSAASLPQNSLLACFLLLIAILFLFYV
ncbi:Serine protease 27 [Anabarilius grahami]|uniref:Serine protease 27 n=1 Tax=Anabarilius grahami TaxID=495550 RepID=A0A3N0YRY8_ANAGA|nr:Serine protease 27 [Anabarilius grahami]